MAVNQYVRDRNGENDFKKGNRTNSKRDSSVMVAASKQFGEEVRRYKEIAEKMRQSRKFKQEEVYNVYKRLNEYIERQREEDRPLTVAGMVNSTGMSKGTWYEMAAGDYDYQLPQLIDTYELEPTIEIDGLPATICEINGEKRTILLIPWSFLTEKAMLAIEEQTEERLYSKGRVGEIFALKAVHGWREEPSPQTVNQTLVIASPEQARDAIKALK